MLDRAADDSEMDELLQVVRQHGGKCSVRELMRARSQQFRTADQARAALQALALKGLGVMEKEGRGRKSEVFRLHSAVAVPGKPTGGGCS
jgi:hypothetical protein